jgi:hypothetical protein
VRLRPRVAGPLRSRARSPLPPKRITQGCDFPADSFSGNIASFWKNLQELQGTACAILDIGCFECRVSTRLLQNVASSSDSRLLWLDHNEQPHFARNIRQAGGEIRTEVRCGTSCDTLRTLRFAASLLAAPHLAMLSAPSAGPGAGGTPAAIAPSQPKLIETQPNSRQIVTSRHPRLIETPAMMTHASPSTRARKNV